MDKEQIEKAASEAQEEMAKRFIQDENFQPTFGYSFTEGANWRINSVWHTTADIPTTGKHCLVEYETDGKVQYRVDWRNEYEWVLACHYDRIIRWAYIEDLIPEKKEDEQ